MIVANDDPSPSLVSSINKVIQELDEVIGKIKIINETLRMSRPDYNPIGLTACVACGATFDYPVAYCQKCNSSFVE